MTEWLALHKMLLGWLFAASAVMFIVGLVAVPWLLARIPADYFLQPRRYVDRWRPRHPWLRLAALTLKNALGAVLLLAGVAMLFLPGQGLLTIFVGLMLLDFPGKLALEQKLIRLPAIHKPINWLRCKAGRPPLQLPDEVKQRRE
jgi:hypothetical protein